MKMLDEYTQMMAKVLFGKNAIHTSFNLIRQKQTEDNKIGLVIGQETTGQLAFSSNCSHVLVLGDMLFRPHVIIESNAFEGFGAEALATEGFVSMDKWIREGNVLLDMITKTKI
jgi:hypothetical protein